MFFKFLTKSFNLFRSCCCYNSQMKSVHTHITQKTTFSQATKRGQNNLLVVSVISIISLSGCVSLFDSQKTETAPIAVAPFIPAAAPIALSSDAENALKAAEQSVIESRIKRVLWRAAIEQLAQARNAAKIFDSDATLKHAREVIALCTLSSTQAQSAPLAW